jgi:hypothetical protein
MHDLYIVCVHSNKLKSFVFLHPNVTTIKNLHLEIKWKIEQWEKIKLDLWFFNYMNKSKIHTFFHYVTTIYKHPWYVP